MSARRHWRRLFQTSVMLMRWEGVVLVAALGFGVVSALATRWFVAFVLLSAAFLYLAWNRAFGASRASQRFRLRARALGLWVWALILLLVGLAVFWRFSFWWTAVLFALGYLAVGIWHIVWLARRRAESAMLFRQVVALSSLPILAAWLINSTLYQAFDLIERSFGRPVIDDATLSANLAARAATLTSVDGSVAVALSGGGYRAAAVHAGILSVLDDAELPVEFLSTVSGGSIVGASYAMGMTADEFRDRLARDKPGLPNDLMNFYPVFAQLFVPGYGSGDTYASHFDRAFFRGRAIGDTGPPLLIVNTTRYSDGTRRAFTAETDASLPLGRLVAASGAFPVAFDPVVIEGERYIDGGVVENLGIAGLQQYFARHADDAGLAEKLPDVLILSDAGLIPAAPPDWNKPSVVQMAMRAQQTSYFAMHQWIYSFYTDGRFDRAGDGAVEQPFEVPAGRLWPDLPATLAGQSVSVFVFSPSSPGERQRFAGYEDVLDGVSALDTLKELSPAEVDAAFWVGARLAASYLPALCAAAGSDCKTATIGDPPAGWP